MLQLGRSHAHFQRPVLSIGAVLLALSTICVPARADSTRVQPQPSSPEEAVVRQKVVDSIRENYRKLPYLSCRIKQSTLQPAVKEREVVQAFGIGKDGKSTRGVAVFVQEPLVSYLSKVLISGESLRIDRRRIMTGEESHESFHNGVFCSVIPAHKWASYHFCKDMDGFWDRDPREVGSSDQKKSFVSELLDCRLTKHETITNGGSERLVLHLERDIPEYKATIKRLCEVDPQRNYLPCRIIHYVAFDPKHNGKINGVQDVEYQYITECKAWFLKKSVLRLYHPNYPEKPDQDGWRQQTTEEVQGAVQVLDKVDPSRFEIEIPPGIEIRDATGGMRQGKRSQ